MNNLNRLIMLLCIIFFAGFSVYGQQTQPMSLSDAIKTGLTNSKNLKLSKANVDIAKAKYSEAADATIPSLKVNAGYTRYSDVHEFQAQFPGQAEPVTFYPNIPNSFLVRASLTEVIFSGFRLKYAKASQQLLEEVVALDAQKDSDEVVFDIISAYYNLYKIQKSQEVIADNMKQVKEHLSVTENWEKQGIVTHNEVLKWELQLSNVELAEIDLENNLNVANYNMNLMLGLKEDTKIVIDSNSLFTSKDFKSLQDYLGQASTTRGDLLSIDARRKYTENLVKINQNAYYPTVSVGINAYDARPNQRIFPLQDAFNSGWDAGFTLAWDLTNLYSNKHNIAEAKATYNHAEAQKTILTDGIKMEVNRNYLSYIESKKKLTVMEKAITSADENYRITDNRYKNQLALQSDLLDADNALLQAKINLVLAKADAELAYYKLLKSTGTIN